jgi:hypothetical protein
MNYSSRPTHAPQQLHHKFKDERVPQRTLSKAIGRDNFSIVAATDEADDPVVDGTETVEAAELMDVNDDVGRSEYNTSWLLVEGSETAAAAMADADGDGSIANEFLRALSGGTLLLGGVGSMA